VLVFGNAVHRTLDHFYRTKLDGTRLSVDEMQSLFERTWLECVDACTVVKYGDNRSPTTMIECGKALIATYLREVPDTAFTVLATEQPFVLELDNLPVPVIGIIDLVEEDEKGTVIITEFKTSARKLSHDDVMRHMQLTLYGLAARLNGFKDREIILRIDCLLKTKKPRLEQFYAMRTEEDEQRLIRLLSEVWQSLSQGIFIPNITSWKCPLCEYKTHCDSYLIRKE